MQSYYESDTIKVCHPGLDSFPPGHYCKKENHIKKTIVYIDGQNFLYKVSPYLIDAKIIKHKQYITAIDIPFLLQKLFPNENLEIRYYGTSKIKQQTAYGKDIEKKTIIFADNLRRLKNYLKKVNIIFCAAGSLKVCDTDTCKKCKASSYKLQEKGVDVGLAVDLVSDALTKRTKHIVLLSSDTDLIPAVRSAKQNSKVKITFIGFDGELVRAISACADETKVLKKIDIIESYKKANPPITKNKSERSKKDKNELAKK